MPVNERAQDHKVGRQGRGSQPPWEDLATIMRSTFVTLSDLRNEIGRGSLMCGREYVVSLGCHNRQGWRPFIDVDTRTFHEMLAVWSCERGVNIDVCELPAPWRF